MLMKALLPFALAVAVADPSPAATTMSASLLDCTLADRPGSQSSAEDLETWCKLDRTQWTAELQLGKMHKDEANVKASFERLAEITSQQSEVETQLKGAREVLKYMKYVPSQQGSIQEQKNQIKALETRCKTISDQVAEQTDQTVQAGRALQNNEKCYSLLTSYEKAYKSSYDAWKPAYQARSTVGSSKWGDFWTSTRALADVAHNLSMTQQECAEGVSGVTVSIFPRPEPCDSDTGGHCAALNCDKSRGATCENQKCVCPPGFCNSNGACLPRADPIKLPADGQAAHVGVHGDALAVAGLAALVAAVAVAARRGFGRKVRLAEQCLG